MSPNPLAELLAKEKDRRIKASAHMMLGGFKKIVWLMENQPNPYSVYRALETNLPLMRELISHCEGK